MSERNGRKRDDDQIDDQDYAPHRVMGELLFEEAADDITAAGSGSPREDDAQAKPHQEAAIERSEQGIFGICVDIGEKINEGRGESGSKQALEQEGAPFISPSGDEQRDVDDDDQGSDGEIRN